MFNNWSHLKTAIIPKLNSRKWAEWHHYVTLRSIWINWSDEKHRTKKKLRLFGSARQPHHVRRDQDESSTSNWGSNKRSIEQEWWKFADCNLWFIHHDATIVEDGQDNDIARETCLLSSTTQRNLDVCLSSQTHYICIYALSLTKIVEVTLLIITADCTRSCSNLQITIISSSLSVYCSHSARWVAGRAAGL